MRGSGDCINTSLTGVTSWQLTGFTEVVRSVQLKLSSFPSECFAVLFRSNTCTVPPSPTPSTPSVSLYHAFFLRQVFLTWSVKRRVKLAWIANSAKKKRIPSWLKCRKTARMNKSPRNLDRVTARTTTMVFARFNINTPNEITVVKRCFDMNVLHIYTCT